MTHCWKVLWGLAIGAGLMTGPVAADAIAPLQSQNIKCMACHAGPNRLVFDPNAARSRSITIDIEEFRKADHGKIECLSCHSTGFVTFPHRAKQTKTCMDCHPRMDEGAEADKPYDFDRIEKEFEATVHFTEYVHAKERCCGTTTGKPQSAEATAHPSNRPGGQKKAGERFTCEHCHEPHYFKATSRIADPLQIRDNDNGPCLHCHSDGATGPLADPAEPSMLKAHRYLPYVERHLAGTRCIDCHTNVKTAVAHDLPEGKGADQGCNSCHSIDSVLLTRLYRYVEDTEPKLGFRNAQLLRHSYVMGANRHKWTDLAAYLLMSFAFALVLAHAILRLMARWRSTSARRNQPSQH